MSPFAIDVRFCGTCRSEVIFEQPDCADGHGCDCPEWVCAQCGEALVLGFALQDPRAGRRSRTVA